MSLTISVATSATGEREVTLSLTISVEWKTTGERDINVSNNFHYKYIVGERDDHNINLIPLNIKLV